MEKNNDLTQEEIHNYVSSITSSSGVVRFHGHNTLKQQTVADHSARVAMLSYGIALEYYKNPDMASKISTQALFHDVVEGILKSDVNSSVKSKYGIRKLVKQIEEDTVNELFPSESCASNNIKTLFLEKYPEIEHQIIKVADTLDFGLFIHSEFMLGNRQLVHLFNCFDEEFSLYPKTITSLNICIQTYDRVMQCLKN